MKKLFKCVAALTIGFGTIAVGIVGMNWFFDLGTRYRFVSVGPWEVTVWEDEKPAEKFDVYGEPARARFYGNLDRITHDKPRFDTNYDTVLFKNVWGRWTMIELGGPKNRYVSWLPSDVIPKEAKIEKVQR